MSHEPFVVQATANKANSAPTTSHNRESALPAAGNTAVPVVSSAAADTYEGYGADYSLTGVPVAGTKASAVAADDVSSSDSRGGKGTAKLNSKLARAGDEELRVDASPPQKRNLLLRITNFFIPHGGLLSGVFNFASVSLGAGIISIPTAFNTSGMIMATVYLVCVTVLTVYSITLIAQAAEKTGLHTYESMARGLFGRFGDIFTAILMWLVCFGGAIGYMIAVGSCVQAIFSHDTLPEFLQKKSGQRCIISAIWLFFMFPLCLPKQINSLRYASAFGVTFIVFFVLCIIVHSAQNAFTNGIRKDLVMVSTGNTGISGLALFIFAYLCQVNAFSIHREAKNKSVSNITWQAAISCTMCGTLYFCVGFFGYAEFGPSLTKDVLQYFDPYKDKVFFVCYCGILFKLCAAFALNMLACRTALFQVVNWNVDTMPYWKHTIVSTLFAVGALILGLFIPDVKIVFGLAGSLAGGFLAFLLPALFVMYSGNWSLRTVGIWHYLATYLMLVCGVIAIVFGTGSSIYDLVLKYA